MRPPLICVFSFVDFTVCVVANGENDHPDFIDSSTNEEEEDPRSDASLHMTVTPQVSDAGEPLYSRDPVTRTITPCPLLQEKRKPDLHSTPRPEERTLLCG